MNTRSLLAFAAATAVMTVSACASSSTTTETAAETVAETAPTAAASTPAGIDVSAETQWFSVEKLWPDSPYMGLVNSSLPDDDAYALSFVCDVDTGRLTGVLEFQPSGLAGQPAVFGLVTSNGYATDLEGVYRAGEAGGGEFTFPIDWISMKEIADAARTDISSPMGGSEIAIVADGHDQRGDTKLLVSRAGFKEHQGQLYYYCNPK